MIRLVLCDTGAVSLASALEKAKSTPCISGVLSVGKSDERTRDSIAAYMALFGAFRELGLGALPCLFRTENGKPYPKDSLYSISISHRGSLALLGISDEGEIGVDVERHTEKDLSDILNRFIRGTRFDPISASDIEICFAWLDSNSCLSKLVKIPQNENHTLHIAQVEANEDSYSRWTALEAVLKCEGCGFGGVSRIGELAEYISVRSHRVDYNGERYTLSLARRSKI